MTNYSMVISVARMLLLGMLFILAFLIICFLPLSDYICNLYIVGAIELLFAFIYYKTKNKYIYLLCLFLLYFLIKLIYFKICDLLLPEPPSLDMLDSDSYDYMQKSIEYSNIKMKLQIFLFPIDLIPFIFCYIFEHKFYNLQLNIVVNIFRGLLLSALFALMFLFSKTLEIFLSGEYVWIILLICGLLLLCISLIYKKTKNKYVYLIGLYIFYLLLVVIYNGFLILLMAHPEQGFLFLLYAIIFICLMAVILCFYYEYKFFNMPKKTFKIISTISFGIIILQTMHHIILKIVYTFFK